MQIMMPLVSKSSGSLSVTAQTRMSIISALTSLVALTVVRETDWNTDLASTAAFDPLLYIHRIDLSFLVRISMYGTLRVKYAELYSVVIKVKIRYNTQACIQKTESKHY